MQMSELASSASPRGSYVDGGLESPPVKAEGFDVSQVSLPIWSIA